MQLNDRVIVVTGGASGIGAAMCRRFSEEHPRRIVVVDLSVEAARDVAAQLGELGRAEACDVADRDQVRQLVDRVIAEDGPIDLFCANAGIATGMGVDAPPEMWARIIGVNLMSHVYAAEALIPGWAERGEGYLLTTASAAGLLTNLGDAPYTVTKAGAVALAEWLAITHGDRGVTVSCLCPQGVATPLLLGGMAADDPLAAEVVKAQRVISPEECADAVVAGLADERFLILPHGEVADYVQFKAADRDRWIRGMRKLQARLLGA